MRRDEIQQYAHALRALPMRQFVTNSHDIKYGDVFVCREGVNHDSHQYIPQAIEKGAIAIIATKPIKASVPVFVTGGYYQTLALIKQVYDSPHQKLHHIGVTGTNGKTTVAHGLSQILNQSASSAYVGTLGAEFADKRLLLTNTTPDGVTLLNLFAQMVENGVKYNVMELSSHALAQDRAGFVMLDVGIITNIGSDHLDYHKSRDSYVRAKLQILDRITADGVAVVNLDDAEAMVAQIRAEQRVRVLTFSLRSTKADIFTRQLALTPKGSEFILCYADQEVRVSTSMPFEFNVLNMLAMATTLIASGWQLQAIADALGLVIPPEGRSTYIELSHGVIGLVDYAHNAEAVAALLDNVRRTTTGQIITVIGVTGDRIADAPQIGKACERHSDHLIFTSDNPLGVDQNVLFDALLSEIEKKNVECISDRFLAIQKAKRIAQSGDVIVVCGKGAETHQYIDKGKHGCQAYMGDMQALKSDE